MCGIAGIAGIGDKALLKKMCDRIAHRGPDHYGYHVERAISLGYRRLSIIDVKGGNQPIYNEHGDKAIVFNGEIYNYRALKSGLEKKGHHFSTNSDTETILHGYEEWGTGIANKLRGMFAFAIWDSKKKLLFIARDKFGKKPLYYSELGGMLGFASEIKSLMLLPGFSKALDYSAIDAFLAYRFIPSPKTIFANVRKLPPACFLVWKGGKFSITKYWSLSYVPEAHSELHYAKRLAALLEEAVRIRLMSEVPLGAYLSGGLDSSSIVGLMSKNSEDAVKTFSVGFGIEKYDELAHARAVSEYFSTDHHELVVSPSSIKELPRIIWHLDEPMADPTSIPTYLLSQFAKRKVTVVLTGEGGDEIFAGYEQYRIMKLGYDYAKKVPRLVRKHILPPIARAVPKPLLDKFFKYSSALGKKGIDRFSDFISGLEKPGESYLDLVQIFTKAEREGLYSDDRLRPKNLGDSIAGYFRHSSGRGDLTAQMQLFDIATELPDDLLMKVDKTTMAFSVEARSPLLDVPLAELAFRIPSHLKLRGSNEKYILRRAMVRVLPKEIIRRKKMRFFVPLDYWFEGELNAFAEDLLLHSESRIFNGREVTRILGSYAHSRTYAARQLWNLVTLELWMRIFLSNDPRKIAQKAVYDV